MSDQPAERIITPPDHCAWKPCGHTDCAEFGAVDCPNRSSALLRNHPDPDSLTGGHEDRREHPELYE